MLDSHHATIIALGVYGLSARCIQDVLRKRCNLHVSTSTIYKALRTGGVRLWDYRNGKTTEAKQVIKQTGYQLGYGKQRKRRKAG